MQYEHLHLKRQLDYARYTHLAIMYLAAALLFIFSHVPHKWWIFLTVLVISTAVEPGLLIERAIARTKGTILALLLIIPLIYVLQLNYRLIPILMIAAGLGMAVTALNTKKYSV